MSAAVIQIGGWLGIEQADGDARLLEAVENRLPVTVVKRLEELGLTRGEIDGAVIAMRTLQHRRSRGEKLTIEESDRVLRVLRVLAETMAVYGKEEALPWLRTPHARLEGRTPLSLLRTDAGSRMVEELLVQIDEGMVI